MAEAAAKWSRLTALSAWQWRVLLTAPFVLLLTRWRLRSGGYRRTLAAAQARSACALAADGQLRVARDTAYALAAAVKYGPWRPLCLLRSLALGWFLGRRGIPFEVRIGVPGGKPLLSPQGKLDFTAHAWVEHAGVVLNDKEDVASEYRPFTTGRSK